MAKDKGGRPKKPTHLKLLEGTYRQDRDGPPNPDVEGLENLEKVPYADRWLNDREQEIWRNYAKALQSMGRLTVLDLELLRAFCIEMARYERANQEIAQADELPIDYYKNGSNINGLMILANKSLANAVKLASRLGILIADREAAGIPGTKQDNYQAGRTKNF